MAEWSLRHLLADADVSAHVASTAPDPLVDNLASDSRRVRHGSVFVAIRGCQADGHDFIGEACCRGAVAVVAQRSLATPLGVPLLLVDDSAAALAKLAATFYELRGPSGRRPVLLGVTGTNGKTTTTYLVRAILKAAGHRAALLGTVEYDLLTERVPARWTTPPPIELCEFLTRSMQAGATHAVMEVSSHALDQRRCDGLEFETAIFTNLTGDHLDYHKTREQYAAAKARLFGLLSPTGTAVVNGDDPASDEILQGRRSTVLRYGIEGDRLDVSASVDRETIDGTRFVLQMAVGPSPIQLSIDSGLIGRHNVANMTAAAAAAWSLGIDGDAIKAGLESVGVVPGRLQRVEPPGHAFPVFVDYAHSDDALHHSLSTLRPLTEERLICVFGCGGNRDRSKRPRMARAVVRVADVAVLTSDNPRWEDPIAIIEDARSGLTPSDVGAHCQVHIEPDRRRGIDLAISMARPGDTVLVAGKGHEDYQEICGERFFFDDRSVCAASLEGAAT
ncbi:MAG: UDP-N-acetylmuramoyl-L-alanyl-D-glutamate--2,6-diaminopimelate ligase [Planctomycetes bacterium]|nr:UDP-N-acetylmuramoyl-L-alanyl-D-glutamate--2,6-diaminopimelate ligase [Planctomycetota bacterium]